ncbi:hypothetical protein LINPERHAP1_LOCUS15638 [Linum perenne]
MLVRNWYPGVEPVNFAKELKPFWVEFKEVPPELLTPEGVSWLATQLGKPLNKLVRNGFCVKVCVLRKASDDAISELVVEMSGGRLYTIKVSFLEGRIYKDNRTHRVYQQKASGAGSSNAGNVPESSKGEEAAPASGVGPPTAEGVAGNVPESPSGEEGSPAQQDDAESSEEVEILSPGIQGESRKKKRRNRKKKDKVTGQHSSSAASGVSPGNEPEPVGEGSPGGSGSKLNAEGSTGNGAKSPEGEKAPPDSQLEAEASVEVSKLVPDKSISFGTAQTVTLSGVGVAQKIASPAKGFVLTRQQHNKRKK